MRATVEMLPPLSLTEPHSLLPNGCFPGCSEAPPSSVLQQHEDGQGDLGRPAMAYAGAGSFLGAWQRVPTPRLTTILQYVKK